ncbi:N-acetylmuramoyl-L-alanine amidase [Pleionea mediterranea]|uniref:N-acetylmuramoyl-L-alanine amidase n=1 Tax=Pleionea mediterranea TaxID=523701 RepID=A0A316F7V9_9GAMM|nr:peptidoglycan recognition family protein [Pleionea mediterranea]PWK42831.1 N-acetylmuramoyl-L-alanine amidase [Pleionea mediterranea]
MLITKKQVNGRAIACAVIMGCVSNLAFAKSTSASQQHTNELKQEQKLVNAPDAYVSEQKFQQQLSEKLNQKTLKRQAYKQHFYDAYAAFPQLPAGLLEAIAFSASRWSQDNASLEPSKSGKRASDISYGHTERPVAHGIMGLYHKNHVFRDVASEAAKAYRVPVEDVLFDARTNIIATAALLDQWRQASGLHQPDLEQMRPLLEKLSGLEETGAAKSSVKQYALDSYVFDVLSALDRGVDDQGIDVKQHSIQWQKVFDQQTLLKLRAPMLKMDMSKDQIEIPGYDYDVQSETYQPKQKDASKNQSSLNAGQTKGQLQPPSILSTDYGPARYVQSPYHGSRGSSGTSAVTVHTTQGSYAGTISWFRNNPYSVSAHYVIRSSDGQITQMVREYRKAHHVGVHNPYTLGIEHEGYVNNPSYYTNAMYNASANLVKHFCSRHSINCSTAYRGSPSSGIKVLPSSVKIKGHQHFSNQTHTDPGIYWNWSGYYQRINGSGSPNDKMLDNFENSEGHFIHTPAYSGSTKGISSASTASRTSALSRNGQYSEQIKLVDNKYSNANWSVRFLSGGGSPSNNQQLSKAGGRIGFWVYSGGSGLSAAMSADDSDGTERTIARSIPANRWTYLEWKLDDSKQWRSWVGGNGIISASSVTLDAIWFYRNQTSYNVYLYIDDVQYRFEG